MKKKIENIVRHAEVSEKAIERYLADSVKELGGVCLKYSNPGMVGYPDRICLLPNGVTVWVELKSKGEQLKAIQKVRIKQMTEIEHTVYVCDSKEAIDEVLEPYKTNRI
ncbi:VRR-NUC domain-containing protein [uncultured Bacteroides sp.]|uniref:VRR-NUC domain-containing protein n=1 Tax=uncultured Bacteroides sp. TaxID=162156 RepID=UPI0025D09A0C|nr:VRR-NUC domain-containing protein [uncultured Bacteroides sp.]